MVELLFLLLPIAFYAGWRASKKSLSRNQKQQRKLSDNFVKGINFLLSEEPDKALEVFLNNQDVDEYTAETYQLLGNLFRDRGEVDRALRVHQNLISRPSLNAEQKQKAMFSLGKDFFSAGMLDRAESVFQELLNDTSLSRRVSKASICASLRTIYEQTQEWQKAIEATDCFSKSTNENSKAVKLESNKLIAHYYCELADEALQQGKLNKVDDLLSKAKKSFKQSTRLMTLEGDIAYHQKNYKDALKYYLKAIVEDTRLLSMLFNKLEDSATSTANIDLLKSELLKMYRKRKDKSVFETLLVLAKKYNGSPDIDKLIEKELSTERLNIESIYRASDYTITSVNTIEEKQGLLLVNQALSGYLKGVPAFRCEHCGYKMHDYLWRCPACHEWDSIDHA